MMARFVGRFRVTRGVVWLLLFGLLLAGCGQSGPLYLPVPDEQEKSKERN